MANWQDIFNQIQNTKTFQPLGNNAVQFNEPVNPISSATQSSTPSSSPNSGGIGDMLGQWGKDFGTGFLNQLDNVFVKPFQAAGVLGTTAIGDLINNPNGDFLSNLTHPFTEAAKVYTDPNGSNLLTDKVNNLIGYDPNNHSQLLNDISPGRMTDAALSFFGADGLGKALGAGADAIRGAMQPVQSVYRQAAQQAVQPLDEQSAILNSQVGGIPINLSPTSWSDKINPSMGLNADLGTNPFWESNVNPKMGLSAKVGNVPSELTQNTDWFAGGVMPQFPNDLGRTMTPTNVKFPQINPQLPKTAPMNELDNLFSQAETNGVPSGREYEYLQGLYPTLAGKEGQSFDNLLNSIKDPSDILNNTPRVNAAGITSQDMIKNLLQYEQKPLNEIDAILGSNAGNGIPKALEDSTPWGLNTDVSIPNILKPTDNADLSSLSSMLGSLNKDLAPEELNKVMGTLQRGTGLSAEDLQRIAKLNEYNPTPGSLHLPEELMSKPEDFTANMEGFQDALDSLKNVETPQVIQQMIKDRSGNAVSDWMARRGIFGSGINTLHDAEMNILKNGLAEIPNGKNAIEKWGVDLAGKTGSSGMGDLRSARDAYEMGNGAGDSPVLQQIIAALQHGIPETNSGLLAEQGAGIAAKDLRSNYLPISMDMKNMPDDLKNLFAQNDPTGMQLNRKLTDRTYTLDREFPTNYAAEQAGYAVHDPITSAVLRLQKSHEDVTKINIMKQLEQYGYQTNRVSSAPAPGLVRYMSKDKVNPLNGKFITPDLAQTLTTIFDRRGLANANIPIVSKSLQNFDSLANLARNLTLYTPTVHLRNVFGNALMAAGISPAKYLEAETAMAGKGSPEMNKAVKWAEQTGALGEHYGLDSTTKIQRALGQDGSLLDKAKEGYTAFQNKGLWDREKALRAAVFSQNFEEGLAKGLNESDAANMAREATLKHMVDYSSNNLSTFEREVMSRLDPYYRWHKGNYPLQFSKLADPRYLGKVGGVVGLENNIQRNMTGQNMDQNLGGEDYKLQKPIGNGARESYDNYLPWEEILKVTGQNPANTLFNRLSPWLREPMNQATNNQYYPSQLVTPIGKDYMTGKGYEIANPQASTLQQLLDRAIHAGGHTVLPEDQAIPMAGKALSDILGGGQRDSKYPINNSIDQLLADLSGGFMSSNPISQQKINAQATKEQKWISQNKKALQRGH